MEQSKGAVKKSKNTINVTSTTRDVAVQVIMDIEEQKIIPETPESSCPSIIYVGFVPMTSPKKSYKRKSVSFEPTIYEYPYEREILTDEALQDFKINYADESNQPNMDYTCRDEGYGRELISIEEFLAEPAQPFERPPNPVGIHLDQSVDYEGAVIARNLFYNFNRMTLCAQIKTFLLYTLFSFLIMLFLIIPFASILLTK